MVIPLFPTLRGFTKPVTRTNVWSTQAESSFNGQDARFPNWSYPKYGFSCILSYLRADAAEQDFQTLQGFINQLYGSANLFQFMFSEDGGPFSGVTNQQFGLGDASTTRFQLVRALGGFVEPVFCPTGTPIIKVNGTPTLAFTIDQFGRVTFTSAPAAAAVLTWTGNWNWYCRFDGDTQEFLNTAKQWWELKELKFTTQKVLGDAA